MGENLKTPMEAANAKLKSLRDATMPDQPKFCVVRDTPNDGMQIYFWRCYNAQAAGTPLSVKFRRAYRDMLAARGPEAEAYEAVPKPESIKPNGDDYSVTLEFVTVDKYEAALQALLSTAKE